MGALCGKEEFLLLDAVKECDCDADIEYIKQLLSGTADRDPIDINQCDDVRQPAPNKIRTRLFREPLVFGRALP
jgi:hypothetical protein